MAKPNESTLRGDFFGGITAGVVALPLALAFGVQSGMGAIAGLYGAIAIGILAAWFGGTPTQISGPTGPMTVVSAVVIATTIETAGSLENALGTIIAIFVLAGIFQIILGLLRIGQYIRYMPYPVVSGFMTGIGVIIIVLQIFPFLGHASPKRDSRHFCRNTEPSAAYKLFFGDLGFNDHRSHLPVSPHFQNSSQSVSSIDNADFFFNHA